MKGKKVLFVGAQGPVSAPAVRLLAPDNDVYAMARFTKPGSTDRLESIGVTCLRHDLYDPLDDLPHDFDYVFHSALPPGVANDPLGRWPESYDRYADATGRLMAHLRPKGFVFTSSISAYSPPGGATPVPENSQFGIHTRPAYAFTKVANEAVISYVSRDLEIPAVILRVGSASGVDGGPMRDRLDRIVRGESVLLHEDGPIYLRPIFEPDAARLAVAALEAGRVPPLVVNWCGDDIVTAEEYCEYFGELVGRAPVFEYSDKFPAYRSLVPDTTLMHETLGVCETSWREGCRALVQQCYPELLEQTQGRRHPEAADER